MLTLKDTLRTQRVMAQTDMSGVSSTEHPKVVHVLEHGLPLCRFTSKVPAEWPEGHAWVERGGWSLYATCEDCLRAIEGDANSQDQQSGDSSPGEL